MNVTCSSSGVNGVHSLTRNCRQSLRSSMTLIMLSLLAYLKQSTCSVMQYRVYERKIHSVHELKRQLIDVWCIHKQSIFDEATDQWQGRLRACVHAKGGHIKYSLWADNVDFVHICYIQCNLFDCCIFDCEIMPATLANTFLFILQGSALADFGCGGRFRVHLVAVTLSATVKQLLKSDHICQSYTQMENGQVFFWLTVYNCSVAHDNS